MIEMSNDAGNGQLNLNLNELLKFSGAWLHSAVTEHRSQSLPEGSYKYTELEPGR